MKTRTFLTELMNMFTLPLAANADVVLGFPGIGSTQSLPGGVTTLFSGTATDEIIAGVQLDLIGARHDWVGDLQITLRHGSSEVIVMGLRESLFFNGTNTQPGNAGAGPMGSSALLGGAVPRNYIFRDGGANFDTIATSLTGGGTIPDGLIYAPTAQNAGDPNIGSIQSFMGTFGGQSTAGTWNITVADTFLGAHNGSFSEFRLRLTSTAIPEPGSVGVLVVGMLTLAGTARRRRAH